MINKLKHIYFLVRDNRHINYFYMYSFITLKTLKKYPLTGIYKILKNIIYSYVISYKIHGFSLLPRVVFDIDVFPVEIFIYDKIQFFSNNKFSFIFQNFLSGQTTTHISVEKNALMNIKNTFYIGNGVKIMVRADAELIIGGSQESLSGITSDSIIICSKKIIIGKDSIISWNVYISDSSQHKIDGIERISDIEIGNNVWLSEGVTISYGTKIGNGSIVGSKSFLNGIFEKNTLIAGIPAKIKKYNIKWER